MVAKKKAAPKRRAKKVTITYLNRQGGGFAEQHELKAGTTAEQFLEAVGQDPSRNTIRIARKGAAAFTPTAGDALKDGDRLSCVPLKIEGACL